MSYTVHILGHRIECTTADEALTLVSAIEPDPGPEAPEGGEGEAPPVAAEPQAPSPFRLIPLGGGRGRLVSDEIEMEGALAIDFNESPIIGGWIWRLTLNDGTVNRGIGDLIVRGAGNEPRPVLEVDRCPVRFCRRINGHEGEHTT